MSISRRQFLRGAVAAGVSAALPAIPVPEPITALTATGNQILSPSQVASEALAALKAHMNLDAVMRAKRKLDDAPVPDAAQFRRPTRFTVS